jgi:hypothetical protein
MGSELSSVDYVRGVFARTGLVLLGLSIVPLAMVLVILRLDGPGQVPATLIGGGLGECAFLLTRSRLRKKVLEGAAAPNWISAGGPELRPRKEARDTSAYLGNL